MTSPSSSAATGLARSCYRHVDVAGTHTCTSCRRAICEGCMSVGAGFSAVCTSCADASRRKQRNVLVAAFIGAAAVVVGGMAFVAAQPPAIEYGEHRFEIERAAARLHASPCDGQSALDLVVALNKERDYGRVVYVVDRFKDHCDVVTRLHWESYGARMQIQDFAGAAADATLLIDSDPDDGDFWWWRAKAKRKAKDAAGAEADMRKAAEISGKRAFWSVLDLADLLEEQGRACEAVPLLAQVHKNHKDESERTGTATRLARLIRDTPCADPLVTMPDGDAKIATLCAALPEKLVVDDDHAPSGFEASLSNTWQVRTRTVAKGKPVSCRAEVALNDTSKLKSDFDLGAMQSWSGRMVCDGHATTFATKMAAVPLRAQEDLVKALVEQAVHKWCAVP